MQIQRSPHWYAERIGRITSTSAKVIVNPRATDSGRKTLKGELVAEMACADYKDVPDTFWMRHGREMEPYAISEYEFHTNLVVAPGTFQVSSVNDLMGDSPDGVVGFAEGCLEAKCPNRENHAYVLANNEPYDTAYKWQMLWHLLVGQYKWCDFVSYNRDFPEHLRLKIIRYTLSDIFPEYVIKGKKYKTRPNVPDKIITTSAQIDAAWQKIDDFITDYQATLVDLGLTL